MNITDLTTVVPSPRQLAWQQTQYYGFIHFGINTMTDREWGFGNEPTTLFDPQKLDADKWVQQMKAGQMQGVILTCKHHDGFCLWPSTTTDYSVKTAPWKAGEGDLVKEVSQACQKYGLKFGIYLSPWDRHAQSYGSGQAYNDFYLAQLTELLTNYGEIFSVWLDGANGEGPNGKKQQYDWERINQVVRQLQPNAVISVCGPDVRWCGNEAGHTRTQEWSVVPVELQDLEKITERSQQIDDGIFSRKITSGDEDLGSQKALEHYHGELVWYPAEVNTSIRPGWFYHESENDQVRSAEELYQIYVRSVGGNATFLLNIPPKPDGEFHEKDLDVLQELGAKIAQVKDQTMMKGGHLSYSSASTPVTLSDLLREDGKVWQSQPDDVKPMIQVEWAKEQVIQRVILQEDIRQSQRIEAFTLYYYDEQQWKPWGTGASVGYQRIIERPPVKTTGIRIVFNDYREYPTLNYLTIN